MTSATNEPQAIYSTLGNDPDLGELVEMYVEEMPDRIAALVQAFDSGDMEMLRKLSHQMKGAAGSYGFNQLTPLANAVQFSVRDNEPEEQIEKTLQELLGACRQVRAGTKA
jgi:HPt (histidine-containing phosphotransfer) domain-containing protein